MTRQTYSYHADPARDASLRKYGASGDYALAPIGEHVTFVQTRGTMASHLQGLITALKRHENIPAPVRTVDGRFIGSHRTQAWLEVRGPDEPMVFFQLTTDLPDHVLQKWDFEWNGNGGIRPTAEEKQEQAVRMLDAGDSRYEINRVTDLTKAEISKLQRERVLRDELRQFFPNDIPHLSASQFTALSKVTPLAREIRGGLADFICQFELAPKQIDTIGKQLKSTNSVTEQQAILDDLITQYQPEPETGPTGRPVRPFGANAPAVLSQLLHLVEGSPRMAATRREKFASELQDVVTKARGAGLLNESS
jgi:hypothetical protein